MEAPKTVRDVGAGYRELLATDVRRNGDEYRHEQGAEWKPVNGQTWGLPYDHNPARCRLIFRRRADS